MIKKDLFAPEGMYLWDSWFLMQGETCHAMFLQAPRDGNPEGRHHNKVSIGHATSTDLVHWTYNGTVLQPGETGSWDDLSLWTGDLFKEKGKYYLFYTGRSTQEFWTQRIGLAVSEDLKSFEKLPEPVLETHVKDYELFEEPNELGFCSAWRDPNVLFDKKSQLYYMSYSARVQTGSPVPATYNACIGLASSKDLMNWRVEKPLFAPGEFDQMECPQLFHFNGYYYLFFSSWERCNHPDRKGQRASGLFGYCSKELRGPWEPVNEDGLILGNGEQIYDIRFVSYQSSKFLALGWINVDQSGEFIGRLSHPIPFEIDGKNVIPSYFN